jgi:hypothetical protein
LGDRALRVSLPCFTDRAKGPGHLIGWRQFGKMSPMPRASAAGAIEEAAMRYLFTPSIRAPGQFRKSLSSSHPWCRACFESVVIALIVVLSPSTSFTQTELPPDAGALLLDFLKPPSIGCFFYPLGKQQLIASENGRPAPVSDFNRDLLALERLGIIRIDTTEERQAKTATFNIALSAKPDEKNLVLERLGNKDGVCIKVYDYSAARVEFTKVEYVKGGRTQWTAAIAHAVLHDKKFSPLWKDFDQSRMNLGHSKEGQPTEADSQYRILFREDPLDGTWGLVSFDFYDGNRFIGQAVPQALSKD